MGNLLAARWLFFFLVLPARNTDLITTRPRKIKHSACMPRKCSEMLARTIRYPLNRVADSLSIDVSFSRVSAANFRRTTLYTRKQIRQGTTNETLLPVCNYTGRRKHHNSHHSPSELKTLSSIVNLQNRPFLLPKIVNTKFSNPKMFPLGSQISNPEKVIVLPHH